MRDRASEKVRDLKIERVRERERGSERARVTEQDIYIYI